MTRKKPFAVFDIDGTIIRWQLYHSIVSELAKRQLLAEGAAEQISEARMTWKRRAHSESYAEYETVLVHAYYDALHTVKVSDFMQVVDGVFEEYKDQVYTYTRDLITSLKSQDYLLFTISGSHHEIIAKLADYYEFDDYVGNIHERDNEYFTGNYSGVIGRKGEILNDLIAKHGATTEGSIAVGDSEGDIAMFEMVERPIVFNPTAGLLSTAKANKWKIVLERKNCIYELNARGQDYILTIP